jgi:hypothetical protein
MGFVVDKVALGQVFSEYFGFPCQSFHRCSTLIIICSWYNRPVVASVTVGSIPLNPKTEKKKNTV